MTAPLEPRRSLQDYADLIDTYGITDEQLRRWIESNPRPVPAVPGPVVRSSTVYYPTTPPAPPRPRRRWLLILPGLLAVLAVTGLLIGAYVVYRFPPNPPAPCTPGTCEVVTPTTIGPPPR